MKYKTTFFRYSGSKTKYTELINSNLSTDKRVYCEPFIGSGAILFNLSSAFDKYVINDICPNIIRMYKTFKECSYSDYIEFIEWRKGEFGELKATDISIELAKANYYTYRQWFNDNVWGTDDFIEGFFLYDLSNSCINSLLRFGKNGMNQGFGNRNYLLEERSFNVIKSVLSKTEIHNTSYVDVVNEYKQDAVFFYDPPYYNRDSSYSAFSKDDLIMFLDTIKGTEYLYTDILNEINSTHESIADKLFIRDMRSTAPSNRTIETRKEYLFSSKNFNKINYL